MIEWVERVHVYACGCKRKGEDGEPPDLCPEHQVPYVTLSARYRVNSRPKRNTLREGQPVFREGSVEDMIRDLERQLADELRSS